MELIKNSPKDCYEVVKQTTVIILERLRNVLLLESQQNPGDKSQFNELQSSLCATLQSVLRKGTVLILVPFIISKFCSRY